MANDAKLGLVLGVGVVLVIGLVFFRNDPLSAKLPASPAPQTAHVARPIDYPAAQIESTQPR